MLQVAGVGWEFVAALIVCIGLGWLIDRWLGSMPWGIIVGSVLGFAVGLYRLIRIGMKGLS